jgi:hypothetical protein
MTCGVAITCLVFEGFEDVVSISRYVVSILYAVVAALYYELCR